MVVIIADIYLYTMDRKQVWQFPTLPEEFPTMNLQSKNEEFSTFNNGDFNILNGVGLKSFSMGFMLPLHEYNFNKCDYNNTQNIVNLLMTSMVEKFPVKFIFKDNNSKGSDGFENEGYGNIVVSVEKFEHHFDRNLDVIFQGEFKEYRVIK